jgi:carbonic anhydrase/acetyltransferase-like protein (isoleucine patch superfamily)
MSESSERIGQLLKDHLGQKPSIGKNVFIAQGAIVVGDVSLGDFSSVWYHAVLRGDINRIAVGNYTNIQDHAVLHLADDRPCLVGSYVTVGHSAILHACVIEDEVMVGMGATILDGAVIGRQTVIGANALVKPGAVIPEGSLAVGYPARVIRRLNEEERARLKPWAEGYAQTAAYCLEHAIGVGLPLGG